MVTFDEFQQFVKIFTYSRLTAALKKRVEEICAELGVEVKSKAACKCKERDRYMDALAQCSFIFRRRAGEEVSNEVSGKAARYVYSGPLGGVYVDGFGKIDGATSQQRIAALARSHMEVLAQFFRREVVEMPQPQPEPLPYSKEDNEEPLMEMDEPAVYGGGEEQTEEQTESQNDNETDEQN